jgi:hypothetical protein
MNTILYKSRLDSITRPISSNLCEIPGQFKCVIENYWLAPQNILQNKLQNVSSDSFNVVGFGPEIWRGDSKASQINIGF